MWHRVLLRSAAAAAAIAAAGGCAVIAPVSSGAHTYEHDGGHHAVTPRFVEGLTPGVTTADGVRWNLGPPSHVLADGHILVYSWFRGGGETVQWGLVAVGLESSKTIPFPSNDVVAVRSWGGDNHLAMDFDPDRVLRAFRQYRDVGPDRGVNPNATSVDDLLLPPSATSQSRPTR
ncbi:MAG TPA: hypothetical protein VF796_26075 [Humisphaera sp.]